MQRIFELIFSILLLFIFSPVLALFCLLIYLQDFKSPFYLASRVGLNEKKFTMIKLRSMIFQAEISGVDSTAEDDKRITKIGRVIRKFKLDEFSQLINVILGDMSLVGPRPNVERETNLYTSEEKLLLSIKPGITDLSSIIFSDEGSILEGSKDPDLAYNQLIRPGKGYLGLFYVEKKNFLLDCQILWLTLILVLSKEMAIGGVVGIIKKYRGSSFLIQIAERQRPLMPMPPVGSSKVVSNREQT